MRRDFWAEGSMNGLRSNKRRIEKLEQSRGVAKRRYAFHPDEIAEAEAQGLPYVLVPGF
jgi:hypothetical protein